eukprot:gene24141-29302_t
MNAKSGASASSSENKCGTGTNPGLDRVLLMVKTSPKSEAAAAEPAVQLPLGTLHPAFVELVRPASLKGGAPTTYSFNEPSFVWESSPEQTTRVRTPVVPLQILSTAALDDKVRHLETVLAKKDHELRMLHERLKYSEDSLKVSPMGLTGIPARSLKISPMGLTGTPARCLQDIEAQGEDLNTARRE